MTPDVATLPLPGLEDVRDAARLIANHLSLPTPLIYSPALSERWRAQVSLKLELATPIGAFKVRGGIYLASRLTTDQRRAGVITASTGNHGQSIAYGCGLFDVAATIYMPEGANPDKAASVRRLGADVVFEGARFDDARLAAEVVAAETGARYVHPSNEPDLVTGVATAALEVLEQQQPDTEIAIVPLGGGSGACAWVTVRDGLSHGAEIWAVQSAQAPAAHDAWVERRVLERPDTTIAEGLATAVAFELPLRILPGRLNDFLLVEDEAILEGIRTLWDAQHLIAEPAAASALAAADLAADRLRGKRVVLVLTGANVTRDQLKAWL